MMPGNQRMIMLINVLLLFGMLLLPANSAVAGPAAAGQAGIQVYLEDQPLAFTVPPQVIGGRVLVPLRPIFEALGATLEWDGKTQTATAVRGEDTVTVQIDNNIAMVNGASRILDVPATAIDGCTLVPLRFAAEAFGNHARWDGASQTAYISAEEFSAEEQVANAEGAVLTPDYFIPGDLSNKYIFSYQNDNGSHSETYTWSQNADGTYTQQMNYLVPSEYGGEDGYLSGETSYTFEIADGSVNMLANEGGYEQAGSWTEYVTSGQYTVLSPVRMGESWSSACVTDMENSSEPLEYSVSASFVGTEEMPVMGVQRTAAHIHLEQTSQFYHKTITCDYWLAPELGLVKMIGTGFGCDATNVQIIRELTSIE